MLPLVLSSLLSLACTKFILFVVDSTWLFRSSMMTPCLSSYSLIFLPPTFSRSAIWWISSKCWSCSSINCFWAACIDIYYSRWESHSPGVVPPGNYEVSPAFLRCSIMLFTLLANRTVWPNAPAFVGERRFALRVSQFRWLPTFAEYFSACLSQLMHDHFFLAIRGSSSYWACWINEMTACNLFSTELQYLFTSCSLFCH